MKRGSGSGVVSRDAERRYDQAEPYPNTALDDLTALAGYVCEAPLSLISLVNEPRLWVKSKCDVPVSEIPLSRFTACTIAERDLFVVGDATQDARFADDSLVTGPHAVRFYAGAPLLAPDGHALGVICVMDRVPRQLTPSQLDAMRALSRQATTQLQLRRQTRELVESESRLRIVTDNAGIGLVVIDPERRYAYANATYGEIFNLRSADILGRRVQDVLPELYEQGIGPRLDRALAGERVTYELHTSSAEGERDFAVKYEPTAANGEVGPVVVVITEITKHRTAERASSRLAAIVESSADAIIGKDLNGIITSWNGGAEGIFGYAAAEIIGTSILRLIPEDRYEEEERVLSSIRCGEGVRFETVRQTKDGRLLDVAVTASPIVDASGRIVGASTVARDISESRRAEEARRFHEAMLNTERDLTLDGILVVDHQSRVFSYNKQFAQMWGVSEDVLQSRADTALLQAVIDKIRDPERFMERVRQLYDRHDETSQDEVDLVDGRVFDRYSAPMRAADGRYYGRVWYFRDVTERRQAEDAVRRERDRAQRYLDTADVLLIGVDLERRITSVNRTACELLGYTEQELLGRDYVEACIPVRLHEASKQTYVRVLGGDFSIRVRPSITRSGEERMIEWRTTWLRDEAGEIAGTFNSGTDVTDRHQAIEAVRVAEERMRFALQSAEVGVWDMDYTTGKLQWSEIVEAHYGLGPGEFDGTFETFVERIFPDDRAGVLEIVGNAMKTGSDFSLQNRSLWPDGTVRWLSGAGRIFLGENGEPVRGIGISIDLTQRHLLEEQYHQAQKMEAIGRLAGGVAHDFNNLLTVILGFADLARMDLEADDPRAGDLEEIQKAGQRAAALTRQLLAFSRKEIIDPVILDLNVVAGETQVMLERLIGEDVEMVLRLDPNLAPIKADAGQVQQIIMNLAVNARDAMPDGGTLTIETASVELDEHYTKTHFGTTPGPYVVITVTDTGIGMSPEVQARVFEPFFTTKLTGKGTGLGLATVHGIVTRAGGTVGLYSEVGKGTAFKVYFPKADVSGEIIGSAPAPQQLHDGTETVLVVEDADGLRDLTKRLLERQGYTVLIAANGEEARRLFEEHPEINLLLTDVVMPGESGSELTAHLLERRPLLKVIYMSGYTEEAITHHGVLNAGIAFVHKPFTGEALGRKIREVLDR